jgi:competence protein ComEA
LLLHFCLLFCLLVPVVGAQSRERININTASPEELMRLPGIGPTIAAQIVEHRRKHGPFKRAQEIIIVHRMNAKLYRQIAHLIRI